MSVQVKKGDQQANVGKAGEHKELPKRRKWLLADKILACTAGIYSIALIMSIITFSFHIKRQYEMKTIDLMRSFQSRYDKLVWEVVDGVQNKSQAAQYYSRYWNLQLEQYEYWKQGYIDDNIYAYWMRLRRATYNNPILDPLGNRIPGYGYQEGWKDAKKWLRIDLHTYDFGPFMEEVMNTKRDIRKIFAQHKGF